MIVRIQAAKTREIRDIKVNGNKKEERLKCPLCHHTHSKKNQNQKDLAWDTQNNRGYCHRCHNSFFEYKPHGGQKDYYIPEWQNKTDLSDKAVKYWESRMISQNTLKKCNVYSDTEYMPQFKRKMEAMCFPYFREGELRNIKFRGAKKTHKFIGGAELLFLNEDALKNYKEIIIVEGEPDYLTWVENGYNNVVSVPNGANHKEMEYLEKVIEIFEEIETVYIAVDNDTEGINLRDELTRRIGVEKCKLVNFKDKKDANDYFIAYGGLKFKQLINEAEDVPIDGTVEVPQIYNNLVSLFEDGIQPGEKIGVYEVDKNVTWELGRLVIGTGVPGSGKSEVVDWLISKLNLQYGWKAAIYSPENFPLKYHYSKLYEKFIGKKFSSKDSNDVEFDQAYDHISNNFFYIMNDYDMTLEGILESAKYYVKKKGISILVIDPYNRIEHLQEKGERDDQYVNRFLNTLDRFAKLHNLLVFLIAHPVTMRNRTDAPTLYDISGGANFYNKAEYGFTVERLKNEQNLMTNEIDIHWQKVKFKHLGEQGISEMKYNYNNGRYEPRESDVTNWDNSNWLVSSPKDLTEIVDSQGMDDIPDFENELKEQEENAPF